jgi:hypothetical protein
MQPKHFSEVHTEAKILEAGEGGPLERPPEHKGDEQMRAYYSN